jgi:fatty-acyl-CoA synthase
VVTLASSLGSTAARVPDRLALVDGEVRLTYAELDARVTATAEAIAALGVIKGDRCAVMGRNTADFVVAFYAVVRAGAIFVPVNPRSALPEIEHLLRDSGAALVLSDSDLLDSCTAAAGAISEAVLSRALPDVTRARDSERGPGLPHVDEHDDALILYTSGTTGRPKGALMDHHRALWVGITCTIGSCGMRDGERLLHVAPLYHSGELTMMLIPGTLLGATHVMCREFDPDRVLEAFEREGITAFFGVPTMYQMLVRHPSRARRDLSAWRIALYGAAPMPRDVAQELTAALPETRLYSAYGQTEAGPSGIYSPPEDVARRPDATGRIPFIGMEYRIVGLDGDLITGPGVGEIQLRGETVMKEYWRQPEATAESLQPDGWLRTGDVAERDADGFVTIVDRLKDLIISGGMNIYSVEVEAAILQHDAVADCAVIGLPHDTYGETVTACVVLKPGGALELDELRAFCARHIADYKIPRVLHVLDAVPRNPSGKALKRELRTTFAG